MAMVLTNSAPGFDRDDLAGTVRALCGQFRLFQENLDFHLGQMKKEMEALAGRVEVLETAQTTLTGRLAGLEEAQTSLEARVAALEAKEGETGNE